MSTIIKKTLFGVELFEDPLAGINTFISSVRPPHFLMECFQAISDMASVPYVNASKSKFNQ